jgi:hypothetical protein
MNSDELHPQLSNNGHPVDGALLSNGSLWPSAIASPLETQEAKTKQFAMS